VVRVADGKSGNWTKVVGIADDHEEADGEHVLTWWQAQDKARRVARGSDADTGRPVTVKVAVDAYEKDLIARRGSLRNVGRIRKHLTPRLASKPVALLTSDELAAWRDNLLAAGMKPATAVRLCKAVKAALNLAARRNRKRIATNGARASAASPKTSSPAMCSGCPTIRSVTWSPPPTRSTGLSACTSRPPR